MTRPRFSLRAALIVFTLIGLGLGLYGRHVIEQRRQVHLVEVARSECEKVVYSLGLHGSPDDFYLIALSWGPELTVPAVRAIGEAQLIKRVLVRRPMTSTVEAELSANFHRADDHSPELCIWERNGWDVPQDILDQRNGVKP